MNYQDTQISKIIVHQVGNPQREEQLICSKKPLEIGDELKDLLVRYFLKPFKDVASAQFTHATDLPLNAVYSYIKDIFSDHDQLYLKSISLAKFLFEQTRHPLILSGDLYVVLFDSILIEERSCAALGIFKSENKETFLKMQLEDGLSTLQSDSGISLKKLDKGCLILDLDMEDGYQVYSIDETNKKGETQYWTEDFLSIKPREDSFFHTQQNLKVCHSFCQEVLSPTLGIDPADRIMVQQKSLKYFEEKEQFNQDEFALEVMETPALVETFKAFREEKFQEWELSNPGEFDISNAALKKGKKVFKSIIKLDKNFHIYVHGNREYIQKGIDPETGLNYYQLFYRQESD